MIVRIGLCLALLVAVCAGAARAGAQDGEAAVRAEGERTERDGEEVIRVDVLVDNVTDLGAFEFVITFDDDVLGVGERSFERGPFLGSSGREVFCVDPVVDAGVLRYECVTLGNTPREGAAGSGLLASIFFEPKESGDVSLQFTRARLTSPPGDDIPATWSTGAITVETASDGFPMWAIVVIAAVVAATVLLAGALAWLRLRGGTSAADTPFGQV